MYKNLKIVTDYYRSSRAVGHTTLAIKGLLLNGKGVMLCHNIPSAVTCFRRALELNGNKVSAFNRNTLEIITKKGVIRFITIQQLDHFFRGREPEPLILDNATFDVLVDHDYEMRILERRKEAKARLEEVRKSLPEIYQKELYKKIEEAIDAINSIK